MTRRIGILIVAFVALFAAPAAAQYIPGQPGFIIDPPVVRPGETVTVAGANCPPGSTVEFSIDGQVIGTLPVSDDKDGTFEGQLVIPPNLEPGTYTVIGRCGDIVMSNFITVLGDDVQTIGGGLPRTGSDTPLTLARVALVLVAVGALIMVIARGPRSSRVARSS